MKKTKLLLLFLVGLTFFASKIQAQTTAEASAHMSEIFTTIDDTKKETWKYLKAVTRGKRARKIEKQRKELTSKIKVTKYNVNRIKSINSEDSLKQTIVDYLDLNYIVLTEDFDKILDMEDIAEQSYDDMEAYILAKEKASEKLDSAFETVVVAQQNFADKYGITLHEAEGDRRSEKIQQASRTLKYYNDIYLIFFKSYKQEAYVLDAMSRNDVNSMEQNINSLITITEEGLGKVDELEDFDNDPILKNALKRMLNFYKYEAERDFAAMTDFYIKKDNFEKISKRFESIKPRNRTKEDINEYNKAVNEYNAAAKKTNKIMETNNKNREKYLSDWNDMIEKFFKKYSA